MGVVCGAEIGFIGLAKIHNSSLIRLCERHYRLTLSSYASIMVLSVEQFCLLCFYTFIYEREIIMTSLKATKKAIAKPSTVEIVLQDNQLLAFAPIVSMANDLFEFEKQHAKQGLLLSEKRQATAHAFCQLMSDTGADYAMAQAYKKHLFGTVAHAQSVTVKYVTDTLNKLISACLKEGAYEHTSWVKSAKSSANSMSKLRAELDALSDSDIKQKVQALAKAEDYAGASKFTKELERRAKAKASEAKRNESKAVTALKRDIKQCITDADSEMLMAFVYTMNNREAVLKLANQTK